MMKRAALLAALALTLTVCRTGGGGGSRTSTSEDIGPEGGLVSLGKVELDIAPDTLSATTEITIDRTSDVPEGNLGYAYDLGPEGVTFDPPVTIRFEVSADDVDGDASRLTVARATDGVWIPVPSVVDEAALEVAASLMSFSTYGVVLVDVVTDGDADVDGDTDVDGDIDGDVDGDTDVDGDADADCSHSTCTLDGSAACLCDWFCDFTNFPVYCQFETFECDCDGDMVFDCDLVDVPMTADACGDSTCCFQ